MVFLTLWMDAAFHYRFITFKSHFPLIKEDLVNAICVRMSLGMILYATFAKFYTAQRMPMAYYVCSGSKPAQQRFMVELTKKHVSLELKNVE